MHARAKDAVRRKELVKTLGVDRGYCFPPIYAGSRSWVDTEMDFKRLSQRFRDELRSSSSVFYVYDTAPSRGKERAVDNDPSSSKPVSFPRRSPITRPRVSQDIFHCPRNALPKLMTAEEGPSSNRPYCSSNTWTSSSADINLVSEDDEATDPGILVVEYNRLARKHGIRPLLLDDFRPESITTQSLPNRRSSWIARILQQVSTTHAYGQPVTAKFDPVLRYRRSISDIALNFVHSQRKEGLQNEDLRGLVRLCGKSIFYLPTEYAPASLVLPTCLRATGQYLVQHAQTSGIFRISGSVRVVNALYDYYCADIHGEDVATTTRCPNLPSHLNCGVHDVASTFKRLLAGLPGGILGSLSLFDALVAIHSQLHGYAETSRTKEAKLRPRLIALAISTVKSKYQRELICAVLGLLCLIGRAAENAPREDSSGRPLPTSDLMGYSSLAIIFGPLLLGDLLNSYSMKLADPASGLILLPLTPCKSSRHRRAKKTMQQKPSILTVDKILVANDITEMLLIHWRDVVRHLKSLKVMRKGKIDRVVWREEGGFAQYKLPSRSKRSISPLPTSTPTPSPRLGDLKPHRNDKNGDDSLLIKRRRQQASNSATFNPMPRAMSMNALSPTVEESPTADHSQSRRRAMQNISSTPGSYESSKNGLPWMGSAADPSLAVGELPSSRAPHLQPASQHRGRMFKLDDATKPPNAEANQTRPRTEFRAAADYPQQDSDSSQETTKNLQSIATPDVDQTQEQVVTLMDNSTRGHIPRHHNANLLSTLARNPTLSENDAQTSSISLNHNRVTPGDNCFGSKYLNENMMLPHGHSIEQTVLSEGALPHLSEMDKFPSYYPSVVGPITTPPEYVPMRQSPDRSQKINLQDQLPASEASGNWSRRHLLSRNSPRSPSPKSEPIGCGREHKSSTSARKRSATTKWRELVHSSPPSSSADLREKRMARHSVHLSSPQTAGPLPNTARRAPTPEWKRQLVKKRPEWKKRSPTWSPEKNNVFEKYPSRSFPGQALSSVQEGLSPTKPSAFVSVGSVSQRSVSKPANGVVKSIAARFDSVSQESTSSRSTVLHSRSQSNLRGLRSFRSQDVVDQSPAKSFETSGSLPTIDRSHGSVNAKANGNSEKGEYSPGRFRDSINRSSHGLEQSATTTKANETSSRLSSSLAHTDKAFTSARNEPQATFSGQGQLKLEPGHSLSHRAMSPSREDPLTASHLDSVHHPSYASAQSHITPWRSDESAFLEQYSPRPGSSSSSSILHTQIRNLKKQLEFRNEEIRGFRRQLDALYGTDVWTLTEQLRQAKRERNMWRKRAETAEKRVAMFEEFTEKFKGLKESINSVTVSKGYEASAPISPSNGKQESGLASSSSCCNHTENQEAFKNRIRVSFDRYARTGGGDGAYSPQTDQRDAGERLDVGQRDKRWRDISNATAQLWIAAEELLNS
ncbi:hypothetical protein SUNI508_11248 [Seiridium unicorne]|uniref:Rho-GAP domain-containing protein n=1 Tax=Seiridium unicorne TaxID=138068 RepID=A0ABR2UIQ2_9PEZI